jgi:hypothetical protein
MAHIATVYTIQEQYVQQVESLGATVAIDGREVVVRMSARLPQLSVAQIVARAGEIAIAWQGDAVVRISGTSIVYCRTILG